MIVYSAHWDHFGRDPSLKGDQIYNGAVDNGTGVAALLEIADAAKLPLREALDHSPHLTDTMMLNGERCPFGDNIARVLAEGDEIYLLAPLAGG